MKFLIISLLLISTGAWSQASTHHHNNKGLQKLGDTELKLLRIVLKKNDELFNALLKENQNEVEGAARTLGGILNKIKTPSLKRLQASKTDLSKISGDNSKEQNLKAYEGFVVALVDAVENYQPDSNYYVFFCPMIKKSWIQDVRTNRSVKNVFAQSMLECGERRP